MRLPRHERGLYAPSERILHSRLTGLDPVAATRSGRCRRPPGARRLADAAPLAGEFPNAVFLFVGSDAWTWWRDATRRADPALCLPPDESPNAFDWSCCRHRDVLLVQAGDANELLIRDLGERIALAEPRSIIIAAECVHPLQCDGYLFASAMPMVRVL